MLIDIKIENMAYTLLCVKSIRNGSPVAYYLEPKEIRVITMDVVSLEDGYVWYDMTISFPLAEPNLDKPVVLHGPKVHSIEKHVSTTP